MPEILEQTSLQQRNTFGLNVKARWYCECHSVQELRELFRTEIYKQEKRLVLGEGSNVLFAGDFEGLVIRPLIRGREIVREDRSQVWIRVGAGENWDEFVEWACNWGYGGLENLSLIPGSVGSSPIQNIGAYGTEVRETIEEVHAIDVLSGDPLTFTNEACQFSYRDSIFKGQWKDQCMITSVIFMLSKQPRLNTSYQPVADAFAAGLEPNIRNLREVVMSIRRSKLPDPATLGNAGSFFKNPLVTIARFEDLKREHPLLPSYPAGPASVKIPAAWLIEQCGWKGRRLGACGTYEKQPLVLVNHGGASGRDLLELSAAIQKDVKKAFGIQLESEVQIIR